MNRITLRTLLLIIATISLTAFWGAGNLADVQAQVETQATTTASSAPRLFPVESIDTVKDSRDQARAALGDPSFQSLIDSDMSLIASSGANYVAIDTPYDDEFLPVLREWVASARAHGLSVWFRGNLSGWEGWFGYASITPQEHMEGIKRFILDNPDLFTDGDIFTACPECENGGPGDPRMTGDVAGYRQFLIQEYDLTEQAFAQIGKKVTPGYDSMNLDVAKLVMDPQTTRALGGIVTIDNYVASSSTFESDIADLARQSGGKIVIGEFGAPIPDINGSMSDDDQAAFIENLLQDMYQENSDVVGVDYWVLRSGSTALVDDSGSQLPAFAALQKYYMPVAVSGTIRNDLGDSLSGIALTATSSSVQSPENGPWEYQRTSDQAGNYQVFLPDGPAQVLISDPSGYYLSTTTTMSADDTAPGPIILEPAHPGIFYRLRRYFESLLR